jgi:GNAT superfamily N-acetyltransferase
MRAEIVGERTTRELRRAVLRPHLGPDDPLPGDEVNDGVHFGVTSTDGTVMSTCFVYADPCPWLPDRRAWHLRQMATDPQWRGRGVGRAVLSAAVDYARQQGAAVLWCNARESAAGFYERAGFRRHGGVFTDERHTVPHVRMWRELSGTPASS